MDSGCEGKGGQVDGMHDRSPERCRCFLWPYLWHNGGNGHSGLLKMTFIYFNLLGRFRTCRGRMDKQTGGARRLLSKSNVNSHHVCRKSKDDKA